MPKPRPNQLPKNEPQAAPAKRRLCKSAAGASLPELLPFEPEAARARLLTWYRAHRRALPWRLLHAASKSPYPVWVSEIMLQQTVIKAVIPVYQRFMERFPDVAALAAADEAAVREAVRGLGYYRRFRFLHAAARQLDAQKDRRGRVAWPAHAAAWRELPGIGSYTSAAIASIALGEPVAVLDGNVERVLCRLLDLRRAPDEPGVKRALGLLAQKFLDVSAPGDFNQAVMELGQTVCTVSSPLCGICPLAPECAARRAESQALAPAAKSRRAFEDVQLSLLLVRDERGRLCMLPRPDTARFLRETDGFPTLIHPPEGAPRGDGLALELAAASLQKYAVGSIRHTITHHRLSVQVVALPEALLPAPIRKTLKKSGTWIPLAQVEQRLIANLDRKALTLWTSRERRRAKPPAPPSPKRKQRRSPAGGDAVLFPELETP